MTTTQIDKVSSLFDSQPVGSAEGRCDPFDVLFTTDDGKDQRNLSVLIQRFSDHKLGDKHILVMSCVETIGNIVKTFFEDYKGQTIKLEFLRYDQKGEVTERSFYTCVLESMAQPLDGALSPNSLLYRDILFREV